MSHANLTADEPLRRSVQMVAPMARARGIPWDTLESSRSTTFLLAGTILFVYASLKGGEAATGMVLPDVLKVTVGHIGLLVPVVALLGLYPLVREEAPRLSLAGAVAATVSGACSIVLLTRLTHLTLTMDGYPSIPEDTSIVGAAVLIVSIVTILLGFLFVGVAARRTGAVPRTVASLLLVPAVMWSSVFPMLALGIDGSLIGVIVYAPISLSLLVVGSRLRSEPVGRDHGELVSEPTA